MAVKSKKRWVDLAPWQRAAIIAGGAMEVALTSVAVRDLVRRPASGVRGPKVGWLLSFVVQPVGPVAYLTVGRKRG